MRQAGSGGHLVVIDVQVLLEGRSAATGDSVNPSAPSSRRFSTAKHRLRLVFQVLTIVVSVEMPLKTSG